MLNLENLSWVQSLVFVTLKNIQLSKYVINPYV